MITHFKPENISDKIAFGLVKMLRFFADWFFANRYGHRAVILETVAGLPGMIAGFLRHLRSLRLMKEDPYLSNLLGEAENERMHLMVFMTIASPGFFEKILIKFVQVVFVLVYFLVYIFSSRSCHRFVGYLEEEAVRSYTYYLEKIDNGEIPNVPAPLVAISYWNLSNDATLRDVVIATREDEAHHRDFNHSLAHDLGRPKKGK